MTDLGFICDCECACGQPVEGQGEICGLCATGRCWDGDLDIDLEQEDP